MSKTKKENKSYGNPIGITQQFRFCGNPLRLDMYKDCGFQCNYCFAKTIVGRTMQINCADIKLVERFFKRAFEDKEETNKELYDFYKNYFVDYNNYKRFSKKREEKDQLSLFDL